MGNDITEQKRVEDALQVSEMRYRRLFETAQDGILLLDADSGQIIDVNPFLTNLIGYSKGELLNRKLWEITFFKDINKSKNLFFELKNKKYIRYEDLPLETKDGRPLDVEFVSNVYQVDGKKVIQCNVRDITDRMLIQKALLESEERFRTIFENNSAAMAIIDRDKTISMVNKEYCKLGLFEEKDVIGISWTSQIPPEDLGRLLEYNRKRLIDPKSAPDKYEFSFYRQDGKICHCLMSAAIIPTSGQIVCSFIDINERKKAEEAFKKSDQFNREIISNANEGIVVYDREYRYVVWNQFMENLTGISSTQAIGKSAFDLFPHLTEHGIKSLLERAMEGDVVTSADTLYYVPSTKKSGWVSGKYGPHKDTNGLIIGVIGIISDITERKKAEVALRESKDYLDKIINSIADPIFVKDIQHRFVLANDALCEMTGHNHDEYIGKTDYDFFPKEQVDVFLQKDEQVFETGKENVNEETITDSQGSIHTIVTKKRLYQDISGNKFIVGIIRDITERNLAEKALKNSERRLTDIINFLPDATIAIDNDGKVVAWNRAMESMTGIRAEDMLEKGNFEYSLPFYGEKRPMLIDLVLESQPEIEKKYSELKWVEGTLVGYAFMPNLKDGVGAYIWSVAAPIYDSQGKIVGAIESIKDITEQKRMREALQESKDYLNKIINSIGDPLFVKDRQHRMTLVNDAVCKLFGRPREEILGRTAYDLFSSKETAEISWKKDEEVFRTGVEVTNEETITYAPDLTLTVLVKKTPYTDNAGNQFLVGIARDITERKQAEDRIKASLQEKDVLLKEVHHRVKNNLQVISALLSLQSLYLTDEDVIKIFRDSQDRIKSMALVHENLYRSKDLGKVDFNEYINQLVSHLSQSYGDLADKIDFKVNSENIYLDINTAIPCGMIINELVSNSLKYAFPDGRSGEICIDLSSEDDGFRLVVSDNGIGIKGDLNIKDSKTLGFRLIDTLVKQIDGKMSLDTVNGARCVIHLKGLK